MVQSQCDPVGTRAERNRENSSPSCEQSVTVSHRSLEAVHTLFPRIKKAFFIFILRVHPIDFLRPPCSCPLQVVTQSWGHTKYNSVGPSPPSRPRHGSCACIARRGVSNFFPRRLSSNRAYPTYSKRSPQLASLEKQKLPTYAESNPSYQRR